jgi:ribose transport system substrate-binding protein
MTRREAEPNEGAEPLDEMRLTRGDFMRGASAVGLAAAAGGSLPSVAAATRRLPKRSSAKIAAIEKVVYPQGLAAVKNFQGPNGRTNAALLPGNYWRGHDAKGVRLWKFSDFKADKPYRIAFANFSSKWDVAVEDTARAKRHAKKMGVSVTGLDNNFDADQAIKNTDLIIQQKFDFAYYGQVFPQTNKLIFNKLKAAGIPSAYLGIPAPGETKSLFIDYGSYRLMYPIGQWIGRYVRDNWGGKVDLVILSAQPRAGAYLAQREVGFVAGLKSVLPNLKKDLFKTIDGQGLLDPSQKKAADLLTSYPNAKYIIGYGTDDDAGVGVTRALEAAGRDEFAVVGAQGGQQSAIDEFKRAKSSFKVSQFTDVEVWSWMISIATLMLMGGKINYTNLVPSELTTKENFQKFPPHMGFY